MYLLSDCSIRVIFVLGVPPRKFATAIKTSQNLEGRGRRSFSICKIGLVNRHLVSFSIHRNKPRGRGICLAAVEMTLKKTSPKEGRGRFLVTVSFCTVSVLVQYL